MYLCTQANIFRQKLDFFKLSIDTQNYRLLQQTTFVNVYNKIYLSGLTAEQEKKSKTIIIMTTCIYKYVPMFKEL